MTVQAGEIEVAVTADSGGLTAGLRRAQQTTMQFTQNTARNVGLVSQSFGRLGTQVRGISSVFMRGGPLIAGITALTAGLTNAARRASEAQQQMRLLENRLSVVGSETGQTARSIEFVTSEVARSMGVSLESMRQAANELVRFRLPHGTFREILDQSARLEISGFGSLQASARRLAEAINDPVRAMEELREEGVRFSEQTVEQVRRLTELDRRWEAQQLLLEGVKKATEDVRANTPSLWSELAGLAGDIATAATRAVISFETMRDAASGAARYIQGVRDRISGRGEQARLRDRGLEQLTEDVEDLQTALDRLRQGLPVTADLLERLRDVAPGAADLNPFSTNIGSPMDFQRRLQDTLALVLEIKTELAALGAAPAPSPTRPSTSGTSRDYLGDLQKRLALERDLLFMNEAQARVEETLHDLRERGVALSPKVEEGIRRQINEMTHLTSQMETLTNATQGFFGRTTDALVEFATTGKFEFKRFADSIVEQMLRIAMQSYVMKPIMNLVPSIGGNLFGGGGIGSWSTTVTPAGFNTGGAFKVPGSGGGDRPTLVGLAPGELVTVTPQDRVNADQRPRVINNVNIQTTSEMQVRQQERQGSDGSIIIDTVVSEVQGRIGRGDFDGTFESRFGVSPRTARR